MIRLRSVCVALLALCTACSDHKESGSDDSNGDGGRRNLDAASSGDGRTATIDGRTIYVGPDPDAGTQQCKNLQCQVQACANGVKTSVSGTVFDPAGKNPLYNITVFVPNSTPKPFTFGASCDTCSSLYTGDPVVSTTTDAKGKFKLDNVPVGSNIPLVVQVGKWRRQLTIPTVTACVDNPQADGSLRLPRNRSEGDIPKIAVSTGGADTLECLLRRIGVDATEYVPGENDAGHVQIYRGSSYMGNLPAPDTSPPAPLSETSLWSSEDSLLRYDILLLSCEGDETQRMNQQALHDYASAGGRIFASHFHYAWFNSGPYASENLATWTTGTQNIGDINSNIVTKLPDGKDFPKGVALHEWLGNVNALTNDQLPIRVARHNADVSATNKPSQAWITAAPPSPAAGATQYFSFNTPTDALTKSGDNAMYCGRVVYSDLHVGAASNDDRNTTVPMSCRDADLSPQEKALEFMLFDLSACVVPDALPPPTGVPVPIF